MKKVFSPEMGERLVIAIESLAGDYTRHVDLLASGGQNSEAREKREAGRHEAMMMAINKASEWLEKKLEEERLQAEEVKNWQKKHGTRYPFISADVVGGEKKGEKEASEGA